MQMFASMRRFLWICSAASTIMAASVAQAQNIDVYFITGQSNAGNIGEQNGTGATDVGFNLTYARIQDQATDPNGSSAPNNFVDGYSSNLLDINDAVNQLAVGLHAGTGNDIAIFTFARNGRPLSNVADTSDSGESWFPGDGTTDYDAELYGEFQAWAQQRLADLATNNPGSTISVNGVFWFQGEGDVGLVRNNIDTNAVNNYQDNFENLVDRFRDDFNEDIAVVATDLRIVTNTEQQALNDQLNAAVQAAVDGDELIGNVASTVNADGTGGALDNRFGTFNTDVHFSNAAQEIIVDRWIDESLRIQALVPEPSSLVLLGVGAMALVGRRRRDS